MEENGIIEVEDLKKKFFISHEKRDKTVFEKLKFSIPINSISVITGESGCGKTTLLRILGLLDQDYGGKVTIDGQQIFSLNNGKRAEIRRDKIGYIFQDYALIPELNVLQNVLFPLQLKKVNRSQAEKKAAKWLKNVGLGQEYLKMFPQQLSGGQQQRVGIARALCPEPKLIIADEPTGNLDKETSASIIKIILDYCIKSNSTLLMVTHDTGLMKHATHSLRFTKPDPDRPALLTVMPLFAKRRVKTMDRSLHNGYSIVFEDTDGMVGKIGGEVLITVNSSEKDISSYLLYWGEGQEKRLHYEPVCDLTPGASMSYSIPNGTELPEGATHLLLYRKTPKGELYTEANVFMADYATGEHWKQISKEAWSGGIRGHQVLIFDKKLWLIGGQNSDGISSKTVWNSEDGRNWNVVTPPPPWKARHKHQALVFKDKMWILGGVDEKQNFNDIWTSENGHDWQMVTAEAPWKNTSRFQDTVFKDKLWILGGDLSGELTNNIWSSENGEDWNQVSESIPWSPRAGHKVLVFQDKLWLLGGWDDQDRRNDIWVSEDGIHWEQQECSAHWNRRNDFQIVVFDDMVMVIGGMDVDTTITGDIWQTRDMKNWSRVVENADWGARTEFQAVLFDEKLYVLGGWNISDYLNDVWIGE